MTRQRSGARSSNEEGGRSNAAAPAVAEGGMPFIFSSLSSTSEALSRSSRGSSRGPERGPRVEGASSIDASVRARAPKTAQRELSAPPFPIHTS